MLGLQLTRARTIMLAKNVDPAVLLRTKRMHVKGIIVGTDARYQEVLDMMEESAQDAAVSPPKPPIVVLRAVDQALRSFGSWGEVREMVSPQAPFAVWRISVQEHMEDVADMEDMQQPVEEL